MKQGLLQGCLVFFFTQIHLFMMFEPWWRRPKPSAGVLRMELHKPVGDVTISVSIFYVQSAQSDCRCACWSFALVALLHCTHAYPPPPVYCTIFFVSIASCIQHIAGGSSCSSDMLNAYSRDSVELTVRFSKNSLRLQIVHGSWTIWVILKKKRKKKLVTHLSLPTGKWVNYTFMCGTLLCVCLPCPRHPQECESTPVNKTSAQT